MGPLTLRLMKLVEIGKGRDYFPEGLRVGTRFRLAPWRAGMVNISGVFRPGPRILVIEHQHLTAHLIGELIRRIGYSVSGLAHTVTVARRELIKRNFDAVLLDIGLDGQYGSAMADVLSEAGIPFAFLASYDKSFEPRYIGVPLLQKPFTPDQLRTLLAKLVGPAQSGHEIARTA